MIYSYIKLITLNSILFKLLYTYYIIMLPIIKKGIEKIVYGFGFGLGMGLSFKLIPISRDNYPKNRRQYSIL